MKKFLLVIGTALTLVPLHGMADSAAVAGSASQSGASSQSGAAAIGIQIVGGSDAGVAGTTGATGAAVSGTGVGGGLGYGVGIGGSANAHNAGNKQSITFNSTTAKQHKNVPGIVAPSLTTTLTDTCMGSITGGASAAGWGLSGGKTYVDEECVRRLHSKFLAEAGQGGVAMQVMCGSDIVAAAAKSYAERTAGVDQCTGENYAQAPDKPLGPTPKDETAGVGPVPLLGPDVPEEVVKVYPLNDWQDSW